MAVAQRSYGSCSIDGCDGPVKVKKRGWCSKHNERWRMHGDPLVKLTAYGDPLPQRLAAKVVLDSVFGCWMWTAMVDDDGYAIVKVDGKNRKAHRVAFELFVGPIPDGLDLDHLCRVRACINPMHGEPVTTGENQRRGLNGVLKTHCRNGHPYTDENVKLNTYGKRTCVVCTAAAQRRYRLKQSAKGPI